MNEVLLMRVPWFLGHLVFLDDTSSNQLSMRIQREVGYLHQLVYNNCKGYSKSQYSMHMHSLTVQTSKSDYSGSFMHGRHVHVRTHHELKTSFKTTCHLTCDLCTHAQNNSHYSWNHLIEV